MDDLREALKYEAGSSRDIIPLMKEHTNSKGEKGMVEGGSSTDHTETGAKCVYICIYRVRVSRYMYI